MRLIVKTHQLQGKVLLVLTFMLVVPVLAACQQDATPVPTESSGPDPIEVTIVALQDDNSRLSTQVAELSEAIKQQPTATQAPQATPTFTLTPSATPTPGPTVAVPEGLITATHELAPGYVFIVDPEIWSVENTEGTSNAFLANQDIEDCAIGVAPATAPAEAVLLTYYPQLIAGSNWLVEGYDVSTYYIHKDLRLELSLSEDEGCIDAQQALLEDVITEAEYNGAPVSTPVVEPTRRPTLQGFTCGNALTPQLRVGDRVLIVAGFLWLREEAAVDDGNEVRLYQQYAPAEIRITEGPVCADGFVFWQVTITEFGEAGETFTGWMAESGSESYFLEEWFLDW